MITQILSKDYIVLDTNTVYFFEPYSDLTLHFETGAADGFNFDIKLTFKTDKNLEQSVEKTVSENEIAFQFINFDNPFGIGTTKPLEIATVNEKKLYMHIWIYGVGQNADAVGVRKVEYTVFEERRAQNGE